MLWILEITLAAITKCPMPTDDIVLTSRMIMEVPYQDIITMFSRESSMATISTTIAFYYDGFTMIRNTTCFGDDNQTNYICAWFSIEVRWVMIITRMAIAKVPMPGLNAMGTG